MRVGSTWNRLLAAVPLIRRWRARRARRALIRRGRGVAKRLREVSESHWRNGCDGDFWYVLTIEEILALSAAERMPLIPRQREDRPVGDVGLVFQTEFHRIHLVESLDFGPS